MARKVVTTAEMRDIEQKVVQSGTSIDTLMQLAGTAVADTVDREAPEGSVLILVGPGNNGGDGLVAARVLRGRGRQVSIYTFHREMNDQTAIDHYAAEADQDFARLSALTGRSRAVVDALLGIGQSRPTSGPLAGIIDRANQSRPPESFAVSVDIPTGVDADTGALLGEAFRADTTVCMGFLKVGAVVQPGAEYAGKAEVAEVGMAPDLADAIPTSVPGPEDVARLLPKRPVESNKGTFGRTLVIAGSRDFLGAPVLCSLAAYRAGAGLVELGVTAAVQAAVAAHSVEAIFKLLPERDGQISTAGLDAIGESLERSAALVFGPGLGFSDNTIELARGVLKRLGGDRFKGAVIDADGLNSLSQVERWWETRAPVVLTPHPGEMSVLSGPSIAEIQCRRLWTARHHAVAWEKVVVLKGAGTIVAAPDGRASINLTGGPNLATGGTGDVLSGIIGGLMAQGAAPYDAAVAGVYLHGTAADLWSTGNGDSGMLASDLLTLIPPARMSILEKAGLST